MVNEIEKNIGSFSGKRDFVDVLFNKKYVIIAIFTEKYIFILDWPRYTISRDYDMYLLPLCNYIIIEVFCQVYDFCPIQININF